jgi:hypothetical protein
VRITRTDGTSATLRQAAVSGDSLVGYADGDPPQRTAIALRDVARVDERRVDADRTGLAVIGGIVGLGVAALVGLLLLFAAMGPT